VRRCTLKYKFRLCAAFDRCVCRAKITFVATRSAYCLDARFFHKCSFSDWKQFESSLWMKYSSAAYFICFCSCLCYLYCYKAPNAVSRSLVTYWPLTYSDAVRTCVVKARIWSYACFNIKVLCQFRALLLRFLWSLCSFKASKH
jgi:hypothetical protein